MRLRTRNWSDEKIQDCKKYAQLLIEITSGDYSPSMLTIDTTNTDVTEVASQIKGQINKWVLQYA